MKAALIGMGVIGKVHRDVLREQGIELAAVCDVLPERREGAKREYDDYREMISKESPDVVHICTPHYLHTEMIVFALEHGCNVLCEKPLTIHLADIDRIIAAEDASSGMLGVCLQNRYNPSSAFAKRYLVGKKIDRAFGEVRWHRDAGYYASGEWRGRWATEGGGVLINHNMEVMTDDYKVIPGLYCVGTDACTIYGDSYNYCIPGNTMGFCLNSGRIAGENAAAKLFEY